MGFQALLVPSLLFDYITRQHITSSGHFDGQTEKRENEKKNAKRLRSLPFLCRVLVAEAVCVSFVITEISLWLV